MVLYHMYFIGMTIAINLTSGLIFNILLENHRNTLYKNILTHRYNTSVINSPYYVIRLHSFSVNFYSRCIKITVQKFIKGKHNARCMS